MLTNSKNNAYMHVQQLISVLKCVKQHTDFLQENPMAKEPLSLAGPITNIGQLNQKDYLDEE